MKLCSACGAESPESARFCVRCGAALDGCEQCGSELPPGVNFCPTCGHPVTAAPPPGKERKLVTVLFADVAGSTELGEQLDPEHLREVLDSFFDAMRREIEAEGGTVEKFIGDAVFAVFGVPVAHEDDPTRALRAALRMRRGLERLNRTFEEAHAIRLAIRIGINTGDVVVRSEPGPAEGFVTGDAVNVAARLEQAADTGQILVGERTARAARGMKFKELGPLRLKGKDEAVRASELLDADVTQPGSVGRSEARPFGAPMVGRVGELTMLETVFRRCVTDRRPQLVTIYGDAGVGKSRLVEEFGSRAAASPASPLTVSGRCIPYGEGVTYWPLGEILKGHAGILDSDPPDLAIEKVRKVGDQLLGPHVSADPRRANAALAYTIGLEDPDVSFAGAEPREVRDELHAAWRSFFSALASAGPVVVVVEDIHWADPALLDLLQDLADRSEGPLLFLCPARPELSAQRPEWGGGRWNHSSLLLEPLSADESAELLDLLVERGTVSRSSSLRSRILERAGGNPFFLEEIVQRLVDEPTGIEQLDIPDTVQGVLAARIDLLTPLEKHVLRSAAVVGRTFWIGAVRSLLEPDPGAVELDEVLWRLEDRGLVHARIGSTILGEREYMFRHILTRDVAYDGLPRRDRVRAHRRIAEWIERQTRDRDREFAELLAHHYEAAHRAIQAEPRPDPDETERLRERAFHHTLLAATEAGNKLALRQAERLAESALALAEGPLERARALQTLGMQYFHDYEGDRAWTCFREAIDLLTERAEAGEPVSEQLADISAVALEMATRAPGTMRHRVSREEGQRYLEIGLSAAGSGDSEERARLLIAASFAPGSFRGPVDPDELERAISTGEDAAAMAGRLERVDLESAALDGIASAHQSLGRYGAMEGPIRRRLNLVPKLTDPYEVGDIHAMGAWWALSTGRFRESVELASRGFDEAMPGSPLQGLYCLDFRVAARFQLGDWDGALSDVALAEELLGDRRDTPPGFAPMHLVIAAFVHDARSDRGTARRYLQLVRWLEETEEQLDPVLSLWQARLLARRGDHAEARALIERPALAEDRRGRDEVLEAWCEVIAEQGAWDEAPQVVERAASYASWAGQPPLALFATRLDGRAAAARGETERAIELLGTAADGFTGLEAEWEAAVTRLDLAQVLMDAGNDERARELAGELVAEFDRAGSVRERARVDELLSRPA